MFHIPNSWSQEDLAILYRAHHFREFLRSASLRFLISPLFGKLCSLPKAASTRWWIMSQQEVQIDNQARTDFGRKPRGERKLTKDADWSKLNLFIRSDRGLMMLLEPTQVRMICQSLAPHLPKHFMFRRLTK